MPAVTANRPKIIVIIQARYGSSRLPGKILKPLGDQPVLGHVITKAKQITPLQAVVVACPDDPTSDPLIDCADRFGALWFKGSEDDVLARYFGAFCHEAEHSGRPADHVIRITSDCPLLDPDVCSAMIELYMQQQADYGGVADYPHGLDAEIFSADILRAAHRQAKSPEDREHVTLWMKHRPALVKAVLKADQSYHGESYHGESYHGESYHGESYHGTHRWVLDYPEDYTFLCALERSFGPDLMGAPWQEIVHHINEHPDLTMINKSAAADWAEKTKAIIKASKQAAKKE